MGKCSQSQDHDYGNVLELQLALLINCWTLDIKVSRLALFSLIKLLKIDETNC